MPLRLLPDIEALAVAYLKGHASVVAQVAGRVAKELPEGPAFPCLTVAGASGIEIVRQHLDESVLTIAGWADDSVTASLVVRTARAALLEMPVSQSRGVVTRVRTLVAPHWLPDDSVTPARPRYVCDMGLTAHPHPL